MKNEKLLKIFFVFILFLIFFTKSAFAESSYVLPYPSSMPGNIFYKAHLVWGKIMEYWYFGSFGQFAYNLKQSDKYLVEAKTLFEYNQYFLGVKALKKSNAYYKNIKKYLIAAEKEGKDIKEKEELFNSAFLKHQEVLEKMRTEIPEKFLWQEEKDKPTLLDLEKIVNNSIKLRKDSLLR